MITCKKCTEVNDDVIFEAFQVGFSDYIIKFQHSKDVFMKNFFGVEGNSLEYSFIALDDDKPVGLVLGGVKVYEGIRTLRCGALCVHPEYRGGEVSHRLFELHKRTALENGCMQMFLEVIAGNDRAIRFYEKKGYEKMYDLMYYSHSNPAEIDEVLPEGVSVERIDLARLRRFGKNNKGVHVNWQNDFDYISKIDTQVNYGVFKDSRMIGALSIGVHGRISYLWISPHYRNKGIAKGLLSYAIRDMNPKRLVISFPNNALLAGFVKRMNFTKDSISQYEMYLTLCD